MHHVSDQAHATTPSAVPPNLLPDQRSSVVPRPRLHSDMPGAQQVANGGPGLEELVPRRLSVPPGVAVPGYASVPTGPAVYGEKSGGVAASTSDYSMRVSALLQRLVAMGFDEARAHQALLMSSTLHEALILLSRQVTSQPLSARQHGSPAATGPGAVGGPHATPPHSLAFSPSPSRKPTLDLPVRSICHHPGGPGIQQHPVEQMHHQLPHHQAQLSNNQTDEQKASQQSGSGSSIILSDDAAPPLPPRMTPLTPTPTEVVPSFVHSRPGIVTRTARSREVPRIHCSSAVPLVPSSSSPSGLALAAHCMGDDVHPTGAHVPSSINHYHPPVSQLCSPALPNGACPISAGRARSEPPGAPPLTTCPRSCSQQNGFGAAPTRSWWPPKDLNNTAPMHHYAAHPPPPLPPKPRPSPTSTLGSPNARSGTPPALPPRRNQVMTPSSSAGAVAPASPVEVTAPRGRVVRPVNAAQFRLFMEQHVENLFRNQHEREQRRHRLESEMNKAGLSSAAQEQMRRLLCLKESNHMRMRRCKMDRSMFSKIKVLGAGAFGEVALVRKKDNYQLYAMKKLKKAKVLEHKQTAHVQAERDILAEADNEWLVKLFYSFQDDKHLYFVMEYIPGGDMMSLLIKKEIFSDEMARFYIAELCLSLQSVHSLGFVHRDVKPDNILICRDGHIKLTDFGLCTGFRWQHMSKYYNEGHAAQDSLISDCSSKSPRAPSKKLLEQRRARDKERRKAYSLVGTPNYIAPEILQRMPYTKACDWWSVGVILYEMLVGRPPFMANRAPETQYKVIHWQKYLHIPDIQSEAENLIRSFCCDQADRLVDPSRIKSHPFFEGIEWDRLRQSISPYIPKLRDELDTSNFDPVDEECGASSEEDECPPGACDVTSGAGGGACGVGGDAVAGVGGACGNAGTGANGGHGPGPPDEDSASGSSSQHSHVFTDFTFRRFFDRENFV